MTLCVPVQVQFFNLTAASTTYAPKWLRPAVGVATGFGGKIWSDCWVAGEETGGGGCSTGDGGVLPAIGLVGVLSALGLGAAVIRRD